MKLSIIIPAYNEERCLPATLQSIQNALSLTQNPSEIIVVDNDSNDRTGTIAEESGATVIVETRHNISRVRNTGAAQATGDVLIFIDADTRVPETLFQAIDAALHDEKCLGGAVGVDYERFRRWWVRLYASGWEFCGRLFNMAQGAAQFCRRQTFEQVGGYDDTIFVGEDVEFYWRLARFVKSTNGYLKFIEHPRVTTSTRRFDKMSLWKTLLLTHPVFIRLLWRKKRFWNDWYRNAVR